MLRSLEVRELGIIERVVLELPAGFVVLTGETGAGKSLLVQSLQLLAGERADSDLLRAGAARLLVEGRFDAPCGAVARALLDELGVAATDELALRREVLASGRSRAWIDDTPVTLGALQRLAPHLLAIHGQHEQRGLADPSTHLALVDAAGHLTPLRDEVGARFAAWQSLAAELEARRAALVRRRDRLDVIAYQAREIEEARLEADEEARLLEERAMLRHAERIGELSTAAASALGGEEGTLALVRAARAVRELAALGLSVGETAEALEQAAILAEDAERAIASLASRVRPDPARLEAVEARLAGLERLARKYGGSVAAAIEHRERLVEERGQLESAEDDIARLDEESTLAASSYLERAVELSRRRAAAARELAAAVEAVLGRLGMGRVRIELRLGPRPGGPLVLDGAPVAPAADGVDVGEFLILPNPGEELRPLARIASGGELSRIHLAMRTALRERSDDDRLTLLFDEVDAGIGGRVAEELGRLLADLGRRDQVLVVTHLPNVAALAGSHYVVSKSGSGGRTLAAVRPVEAEERVEELVRMLGGGERTPAARAHARELLGAR